MNFDKLIARAKNILLTPKTEWPVIAAEPETVAGLYKNYILILAAIPAVMSFLLMGVIGIHVPGMTLRVDMGTALVNALIGYVITLGVVYGVALVIDMLAPNFGAERNQVQALKTAAYSYTAGWIGSIGLLIPGLGFLLALAAMLYGLYLLYLGLPHTMKVPSEKHGAYTAVIVIVAIVLGLIVGAINQRMMQVGNVPSVRIGMHSEGTSAVPAAAGSAVSLMGGRIALG